MKSTCGLLIFAFLAVAAGRLQNTDEDAFVLRDLPMPNRNLLTKTQEASAEAAALLSELAGMEEARPAASEKLRDADIDTRCRIDSSPFFETSDSSYAGCLISCVFVDYCGALSYTPGIGTCRLYHRPTVTWTDDSPDYCWEVDMKEAPASEEAPPSEEGQTS